MYTCSLNGLADVALPAGAVVAGVAPSPAIVKKVKKVVETRLDAPELATALQQLSEFYGELGGFLCLRERARCCCCWEQEV